MVIFDKMVDGFDMFLHESLIAVVHVAQPLAGVFRFGERVSCPQMISLQANKPQEARYLSFGSAEHLSLDVSIWFQVFHRIKDLVCPDNCDLDKPVGLSNRTSISLALAELLGSDPPPNQDLFA